MSKMANQWEANIGEIVPYLEWNEVTDGKINVWETGPHSHALYELHIILSGECSLFINDSEVTLKAGQGILISPNVFHAPSSVTQPFRRLSVPFFPDKSKVTTLIPEELSFLPFTIDDEISVLCEEIISEAKKESSLFHKEMMSNQFSLLMLRVFRIIEERTHLPRASISKPKQLEDMTIIDKFFAKTSPKLRTKENLAKLLHCSQRQVLRKIYTLYGMSFQKKQSLSRIDTAQYLLRFSDKSVEDICAHVGYSDIAAFYKAFKQCTNLTPIKYRKRITGQDKE